MLELQLSAGPFCCYHGEHLNESSLTTLTCSLSSWPGAELPQQGLCTLAGTIRVRPAGYDGGCSASPPLLGTGSTAWAGRSSARLSHARVWQQLQAELSLPSCGEVPWDLHTGHLSELPQPCLLPPSHNAGDPWSTSLSSRRCSQCPKNRQGTVGQSDLMILEVLSSLYDSEKPPCSRPRPKSSTALSFLQHKAPTLATHSFSGHRGTVHHQTLAQAHAA